MEPRLILPFSSRSDFGSPDPQFAELHALAAGCSPFFDLTASSPGRAGVEVPHPLEMLKSAGPSYAADPRGLLSARLALTRCYAERVSLSPDQLLLTASTSEAYSFTLLVLCNPGEKILVPRPSYPLFSQLAQIAGVKLVTYRIGYDGAFHTDLGTLPSKEEAKAQGIKAIFAVSPNNPTGNCLREEELQRFRALSIPLIVDEVFLPYCWATTKSDPLTLAEDHPLTVVVDGLSKRAAAPGLKLGWMLAVGTEQQGFLERAEWVSDAYLSPGSLVQEALPQILKQEPDLQRPVLSRLMENKGCLEEAGLNDVGITELRTEGGFTALLRFPGTLSEDEWWRELCSDGIWLQPGQLYNLEQTPAFAVSLLTAPNTFRTALSRIRSLAQRLA